MKPTDEERREVARKLRKNAEEHPKMQLILNVAFACDSLRPEGAMDWNVTAHDAAMYLADLIEPDPERICVVEHRGGGVFYLSCGHDSTERVKPDYCPTCGARVVD